MRAFLTLFVAMTMITGCSEELVELIPQGGEPCVQLDDGTIAIGEKAERYTCHLGYLYVDREHFGNYDYYCVGSMMPFPEVCDAPALQIDGTVRSLDEDCDGLLNEIHYRPGDLGNTCYSDPDLRGVCRLSDYTCINGEMVCLPPEGLYGTERCDRLDNDCDGLTDAEDSDLVLSADEFQYYGPDGTLNVGMCRAGVLECVDGSELLRGEQRPAVEVCTVPGAPAFDEDCDGLTDEDETPNTNAESILMGIDGSGSMIEEINAVAETICQAADSGIFNNSTISIQLVGINSYQGAQLDSPFLAKLTDFVSFTQGCDELTQWMISDSLSGGSEYMAYGLYAANTEPIDGVGIDWPEDATRRAIIFTDEPPSGLDGVDYMSDFQLVMQNCIDENYSVGVFADFSYDHMWQPLADACSGWVENLTGDVDDMVDDLAGRLGAECGI